jgi:hypothetical protein
VQTTGLFRTLDLISEFNIRVTPLSNDYLRRRLFFPSLPCLPVASVAKSSLSPRPINSQFALFSG